MTQRHLRAGCSLQSGLQAMMIGVGKGSVLSSLNCPDGQMKGSDVVSALRALQL